MRPIPPKFPSPTADQVIALIDAAFGGVMRDEGISWSECVVLDNYGSEAERAAARKLDHEPHWSKLVEDATWEPFPGVGGFSFIDALGFRYYLPPTMVRFVRGDISEWYPGHLLSVINRFVPAEPDLFDDSMRAAIAVFVLYMSRADPDCNDENKAWTEDLHMRWQAHLPSSD